jgi:hypothetical protein
MPYVVPEARPKLDDVVEVMAKNCVKPNGGLNYVLFAYCKRHIQPSYGNYKNYIGEIIEASCEIRRRLLAPYEDEKIKLNGDVV